MTGLEPALYGFAIRRLAIRHTPTSIGLQCGIRTHIIPRPKRGAITRLGEPERISFLHSLMTLKELIDCDGWTQTSDLYIYLVTPRTVNCSATHSATLMFVFGPGWCPSDAKSIT